MIFWAQEERSLIAYTNNQWIRLIEDKSSSASL